MGFVEIIEDILNLIRRVVRKIVIFIEYLANHVETSVWVLRNKIIFLALLILFIPFTAVIINIEGAGQVLITFVVVDMALTLINLYRPKNRIIPLRERLFSILPYVWVFVETTLNYFEWSMFYIEDVLHQSLGSNEPYLAFVNFIEQYTNLPGGPFLQVGFFFLFYYGIGRNKLVFPFFVRYNYTQAVLFTGFSTFICHIFMVWAKIHTVAEETSIVAVVIYSCTIVIFGFCILSTIFARESKIPFIHDAILYHTGLREDDGTNPLDVDEYDK